MPKLMQLSGRYIVKILGHFNFNLAAQKGSHVKLVRITFDNQRQVLTIPNHDVLDRGTAHAIYRQILKFIPEDEIRKYFYTE